MSLYLESDGAIAQNLLFLIQKFSNSIANSAIAIRTNLGEAALQQLKFKQSLSSVGTVLLTQLNLDTIVESDDSNATIMDVNGKTKQLLHTAQGWKINYQTIAELEDPQFVKFKMMMLEELSSLADSMDTITGKLNAGEITSLNQLTQALEALSQASPF